MKVSFGTLFLQWIAYVVYGATLGKDAYDTGITLTQLGRDEEAAEYFWSAILKSNDDPGSYDVRLAVDGFMGTYRRRRMPEQGLLRIAKQFKSQGFEKEAMEYLNAVLSINPDIVEAHLLLGGMNSLEPNARVKYLISALQIDPDGYKTNFDVASQLWDLRAWDSSLSYFERAFQLNSSCHASLSTSIYLRQYICKWGDEGMLYQADLDTIEQLTSEELLMLEDNVDDTDISTVTVHPHMALSYNIPPHLKLEIAKSHSRAEKALVKESGALIHSYKPSDFREEAGESGFRIKVGYVSANIKSKTTVYMAQDLFRFHNRSNFEIHVYATTPNDSQQYIDQAMDGVDWRAKVRNSVEFFHDMSGQNVLQICNAIRAHGIHILLNWDGYSNNGVRPTGLFPMQCAPLQVAHQEYISTMGADFIQYMIGDVVAAPPRSQHLYSEKFIYLPHCFLANSMSYLAPQILPPTLKRAPGSDPKENGCGGEPASFIYCNFNKHLKFSPDVFRSWLKILQNVDDSVLCLLENPSDSIKYLMHFIENYDKSLLNRVRFQSFVPSPFDNQRRTRDMCHAILDTPVYNGHTTAADALWGGVPIVVYGDGPHMAGRVGHSIMTTLEIPELIAQNQSHYNQIAISLGQNSTKFRNIRRKLINTVYATNPKNPFWDMSTYVKNLETGYDMIWKNFLQGKKPRHMYVRPAKSTFASEIYKENFDAENAYLTKTFPTFPLSNLSQAVDGYKLMGIHDLTKHLFNLLDELEKIGHKSLDKETRAGIEGVDGPDDNDGSADSNEDTNKQKISASPSRTSSSSSTASRSRNDVESGKKKSAKQDNSKVANEEMCSSSTPLTVQTSRKGVKRQN